MTSSSSVVMIMRIIALLVILASVMVEVNALTKNKRNYRQKQLSKQLTNHDGRSLAAEDPEFVPEDPFFHPKTGDYVHDSSDNPLLEYERKKAGEESIPEEPFVNETEPPAPVVNTTEPPVVNTTCVTREDSRATGGVVASVAAPGTACVFGVDERDEGSHCIMQEVYSGAKGYGSYGWCWTDEAMSQWGSCDEGCPLSGHAKVLGTKMDRINGKLEAINEFLNITNGTEENTTNATNATMTAEEEPAAAAADGAADDAAGDDAVAAAGGDAAAAAGNAAADAAPAEGGSLLQPMKNMVMKLLPQQPFLVMKNMVMKNIGF